MSRVVGGHGQQVATTSGSGGVDRGKARSIRMRLSLIIARITTTQRSAVLFRFFLSLATGPYSGSPGPAARVERPGHRDTAHTGLSAPRAPRAIRVRTAVRRARESRHVRLYSCKVPNGSRKTLNESRDPSPDPTGHSKSQYV
eukprot:6034977-Prymnesium_polylepis.1